MAPISNLIHEIADLTEKGEAKKLGKENEALAMQKYAVMRDEFKKCCDDYLKIYQALHAAGEYDADVAAFVFETGGRTYRITVNAPHIKACGCVKETDVTLFYSTNKRELREFQKYIAIQKLGSSPFILSCRPEDIYPDFTSAVELFLEAKRDKLVAKREKARDINDDLKEMQENKETV